MLEPPTPMPRPHNPHRKLLVYGANVSIQESPKQPIWDSVEFGSYNSSLPNRGPKWQGIVNFSQLIKKVSYVSIPIPQYGGAVVFNINLLAKPVNHWIVKFSGRDTISNVNFANIGDYYYVFTMPPGETGECIQYLRFRSGPIINAQTMNGPSPDMNSHAYFHLQRGVQYSTLPEQ